MRTLIALIRQWEFFLAALLALVAALSAAYLFQVGDADMALLCTFTCAGFIWDCQGFSRVGTVHLRLPEHDEQNEEG